MAARVKKRADKRSTVTVALATDGPTMQRDLAVTLKIDRATLSGVVAALVRKGHIDQLPHPDDQRQRILKLTETGIALWASLPDPIALVRDVAFSGADPQAMDSARDVVRAATERLIEYQKRGNTK